MNLIGRFSRVPVVAQPDSGLVFAKGFYRLLGTAVEILVTTALVFGLAEYGELFIASLAAWIGVCSFAERGIAISYETVRL